MSLTFTQQDSPQTCLITLTGPLDIHTVNTLWGQREALFAAQAPLLTFDLQHVTHCDSSTVALLTALMAEAAKRHKTLRFIHVSAQLIAIANVCGVDDILPMDTIPA